MSSEGPQRESRIRRLFGGLLMAVGGLIATLCGLCSVAFLVNYAFNPDEYNFWIFTPVVGGVPILIGVGLFVLGRRIVRENR